MFFFFSGAFHPETECTNVGGNCFLSVHCPEGQSGNEGLCPNQQNQGVECCFGSRYFYRNI